MFPPQRIVCLTEETTERLYLLGEERRIVGISGYTVRPRRARARSRVSRPSSMASRRHRGPRARPRHRLHRHAGRPRRQAGPRGAQRAGHQPANIAEIFATLGSWRACSGGGRGAPREARAARRGRGARAAAAHPRVYFEEWDDPMISGIRWVSELIAIAGGIEVFPELTQRAGGDRCHRRRRAPRRAPESSWGAVRQEVRPPRSRRGRLAAMPAVREGRLHEIKSRDPAARTGRADRWRRAAAPPLLGVGGGASGPGAIVNNSENNNGPARRRSCATARGIK